MNIEADVKEIRQQVAEISKKLDQLLLDRETLGAMKMSEQALYAFPDEEPDLYSVRNIKVAYNSDDVKKKLVTSRTGIKTVSKQQQEHHQYCRQRRH